MRSRTLSRRPKGAHDADICVIEDVFGRVGAVTASVQGASVTARTGAGFGPGLPGRGPGDGHDGWILLGTIQATDLTGNCYPDIA